MTPTKQLSMSYQTESSDAKSPNHSCRNMNASTERMEISYSNSSPEKHQQESASSGDGDASSESFAYLREVIDNPANTIVQDQIDGKTVKMLVVLPTGEQRLITFDLPNEDCTVQDLLEQAQIPYNSETLISLVSDTILNINYIVESEIGTLTTTRDTPDTNDRELDASEDNSNAPAPEDHRHTSFPHDEEPKFIEGKLALCSNCGISSMDFNRCTRCKKKFPHDVKQVPMNSSPQQKKETMLSIDNFYKGEMPPKPEREGVARRGRGGNRYGRVPKIKPAKEPECLTLSSDDEEDDGTNGTPKKGIKTRKPVPILPMTVAQEESDTIFEKEPIITNDSVNCPPLSEPTESMKDCQNIPAKLLVQLQCRTVRIGSYKYVPHEKVVINDSGLRLQVPLLEDNKCFVTIHVKFNDIIKVLIHFGKAMPVIFFYTSTACAVTIRELLGMQDAKGPYYDPASKDHTHKRITLLPDKIPDEEKNICKYLFTPGKYLEELNHKEANEILLRASPKDKSQMAIISKKPNSATPGSRATTPNGRDKIVHKMTVYPPPPQKGGIAINTEDYACLAEDQFLNDVIIDFYLKYLTLEVLSEVDQQRTHVFSSYFYKRLTSRHAQAAENSSTQTAAAKRHARVQKWTKNVNIFDKDFVIIPINEHAHWFLAIICFPGLVGSVSLPPSPAKAPEAEKKNKKKKEIKTMTIGSTTITQVATTITIDPLDDDSERDEAEGDDEEMEMETDTDEDTECEDKMEEESPPAEVEETEIIKSPCILIFDSLAGASRSRVVATLRDYLTCEHAAKMNVEKIFTRDNIKGSCPKIPQQSNFTDCGLYVLQYVENFFKEPIMNYIPPIKTLKNWFEEIVVTRKREELSNLLIKLMNQTKGDKVIQLPSLQFPTQDGLLKPKPESSEKTEIKATKTEESKKKSSNEERNNVQSQIVLQQQPVEAADLVASKTIYTIVGCTPTLMVLDVTPKPSSTGSTLAYLKNKRIPRLMRDSETQESQVAAKKHKGDIFDSCK